MGGGSGEGGSAALEVHDVSVVFGDTRAVDHVDLRLDAGQVLAVLGPSGCGKSTLLRAIAGLEPLASGRVLLGGRDQRAVPTHRRGIALMFQDGQLFPHRSVAGNVAYPLQLRRTPQSTATARVTDLLDLVGLAGYDERAPATLSGGEQQRVALARSLAADPRLLLLDEPLSALDRALRERLAVDLRAILSATSTTSLLVTHDHDEAFTVADQVAVMLDGRLVQQGPVREVWSAPVDEEVARFLGYRTVLTGDPADRLAEAAGIPRTERGGSLALRRSALRVSAEGGLEGRVCTSVAATDAQRVTVDVDGVGVVEALADAGTLLDPGAPVRLAALPSGMARLPRSPGPRSREVGHG